VQEEEVEDAKEKVDHHNGRQTEDKAGREQLGRSRKLDKAPDKAEPHEPSREERHQGTEYRKELAEPWEADTATRGWVPESRGRADRGMTEDVVPRR
jgi:hypothetical protein